MIAGILALVMTVRVAGLAFEIPPPPPAEIMQRVGANQDREQKARAEFVYEEVTHRAMRRRGGKVVREETRVYAVMPHAKGRERKLQSVNGRYWKKGKYIEYDRNSEPEEGLFGAVFDDNGEGEGDVEGGQTKDGVEKNLFPLTTEQQKKYVFELAGEQPVDGRPAYRIRFRPPNIKNYGWAGEALIDKEEFQPVSVFTKLSRKLPVAVRTMLGTDVPGLGFSVRYKRVDKDLWFPASYGTEFGVHAVFVFSRSFSESTENRNFRRANVESRVAFDEPKAQ